MDTLRHLALASPLVLALCGCGKPPNTDPDFTTAGCGPCPDVATGDLGVTGIAAIDVVFEVTASVSATLVSTRASFDTEVLELARAWGHPIDADAEVDVAAVDALFDAIAGELDAATTGDVGLAFRPGQCTSNLEIGAQAQVQCEAQAGCDVEAMQPSATVQCEGTCEGTCSGNCDGAFVCESQGGIACDGDCEGVCALDEPAPCDGICEGACTTGAGTEEGFEGACDGSCQGTCDAPGGTLCSGTCHGTCVDDDAFACEATMSCRGSCDLDCTGSCLGEATPASASSECEASADCAAAASMRAEADVQCTPPTLRFSVDLTAELRGDVHARAAFQAKLRALERSAGAIGQNSAKLHALFDGDFDGDGEPEVTPLLARVRIALEPIGDAGVGGLSDTVPAARIGCLIPAFIETGEALAMLGAQAQGLLSTQATFMARLSSL